MSPDGSTKPSLPEEKLLRLIRGKASRPDAAGGPVPSQDAVSGAASKGSRARAQAGVPWSQLAVACLGLILAGEFVLLILQAVRPLPMVTIPVVASRDTTGAGQSLPPQEEMPSLAQSASPSLFTSPVGGTSSPSAQTVRVPPSSVATNLASRLTLLGIIPGDPAQAIIEDSQTKKTFFVAVGQAVVEGAVLDQVLESHVILDLQGEKIELTL